jgi:uncharacterized protein
MNGSYDVDMAHSFLMPVGTQVVLRQSKRIPGKTVELPAGSVAEVIESPTSNDRPYLVRFFDGLELRVKIGEVLVRRSDHGVEAVGSFGPDVSPYVILKVTLGSRAFGLANDDSDEDRRGVYLAPAKWHWSLTKPPEQVDSTSDGVEEVVWELEKFLRLALQANPNILEVLWSPRIVHADEFGKELLSLRTGFLSRHLYRTYSGYVLSQFRLMKKGVDRTGKFKPKHAMHLLRLLLSGIHALKTAEIRVDVAEHREELLAVRSGQIDFDRVRERAQELDREFKAAFESTGLPERPDTERVNAFLVSARRRRVTA